MSAANIALSAPIAYIRGWFVGFLFEFAVHAGLSAVAAAACFWGARGGH